MVKHVIVACDKTEQMSWLFFLQVDDNKEFGKLSRQFHSRIVFWSKQFLFRFSFGQDIIKCSSSSTSTHDTERHVTFNSLSLYFCRLPIQIGVKHFCPITEPRHDKTHKVTVRPAKTQIRPV